MRRGAGTERIARQRSFEDLGQPLIEVTFVVVDLETTGLSPTTDRITEVGAVKVRGGERLGELQTLVHPGRPIPAAITAVTGISDGMVAGFPSVDAVLPAFLEFARGAVLVAHNARFDVSFLDAELARLGHPRLDHQVLDTARIARRVLFEEVRDLRLATLARHLRSPVLPEHRALTDARATVHVFHGLLERAGTLGATTLEDLHDYTRSTSDRAFRKVGLVRHAPPAPGVYRFVDARGEVLYVGRANDLRRRLRQYFGQDPRRRIAEMVRDTAEVRWQLTPTEIEAAVVEVRAIHAHRPRYNRRSKHPERTVWVKLTRERFPRLSIVTSPREDGATYLGPVASRRVAEEFVDAVHDVLPLRRCTHRIRAAQDHPTCVLKDLGRCGSPCDGTQSPEAYRAVVDRYLDALTGDPSGLLDALRSRMEAAATERRFERAASLRRMLHTQASVLTLARRLPILRAVAELCVARMSDDGVEIVLVRRGCLVGSVRVPAGGDLLGAARTLARHDGEDGAGGDEELRLVSEWLRGPGVRVLWVDGELTEPVAGGAALARYVAEARRVSSTIRRDRQVLSGTKVVRRGGGQTSSNQPLQTSSTSGRTPAMRPSQVTRTR